MSRWSVVRRLPGASRRRTSAETAAAFRAAYEQRVAEREAAERRERAIDEIAAQVRAEVAR